MRDNKRRDFLKISAFTAASIIASPVMATNKSTAGEDYKALVVVLLEGGADTLSMLVPNSNERDFNQFKSIRPHIASTKDEVLKLKNTHFGLHPNMSKLQRIYNSGNMAIMANVGVLDHKHTTSQIKNAKKADDLGYLASRLDNHIDQQDHWMMAGDTKSGWAAKVADELGYDFVNISVAGQNSMQYGSKKASLVAHDDIFGTHQVMEQVPKAMIDTYFNKDEMCEGKSLGEQLDMVLNLIEFRKEFNSPKRQIFFVSHSGWDIHNISSSNKAKKLFNQKVAYLDHSLGEFYSSLDKLGLNKKVTTFTMSEFGRSVTKQGEDHGWGGHALVLGGSVNGGIYGKMPKLSQNSADTLENGSLVPTTSTQEYLSPLIAWLGEKSVDLKEIFPNREVFSKSRLNFIS